MPSVLREPGGPRLAEPQKSRCSLPGESDWPQSSVDHVEIEVAHAVLVLRGVHDAQADADPEPLQRGLVEQHVALGGGVVGEELDGERLALGVDALAALDLPAGFLQQPVRLAQVLAHGLRVAVHGRSCKAW